MANRDIDQQVLLSNKDARNLDENGTIAYHHIWQVYSEIAVVMDKQIKKQGHNSRQRCKSRAGNDSLDHQDLTKGVQSYRGAKQVEAMVKSLPFHGLFTGIWEDSNFEWRAPEIEAQQGSGERGSSERVAALRIA